MSSDYSSVDAYDRNEWIQDRWIFDVCASSRISIWMGEMQCKMLYPSLCEGLFPRNRL